MEKTFAVFPPDEIDGSSDVEELSERNRSLRVETARLRDEAEALKQRLNETQNRIRGDRASRLAALNLMEDAITARRRAENAIESLRESEEKLRAFLLTTSDTVYRMSADWSTMHHLTSEVLHNTGQSITTWMQKYIPPVEHERALAAASRAIETKGTYELEHRVILADGSIGWTLSRAIPILNSAGQIVEWFGAASDITGRKRREMNTAFLVDFDRALAVASGTNELLRVAAEQIEEFYHASFLYGVDIDPAGESMRVHSNWQREMVSVVPAHLRFADFATKAIIDALRQGETAVVADTSIDPRTCAERCEEIRMRAFLAVPYHHESHFKSLLAIYVTQARKWREDEVETFRELVSRLCPRLERSRTEEEMRASEERFRMALESAEMASWDFDIRAGRIVWNEQHYRLLGLKNDGRNLSPEDFFQHVHPDDVAMVREQIYTALNVSGFYQADFRVVRANDKVVRWMSGFGKAMAREDGHITRLTGVMLDVTERHESAEKLAAAQELWRIVVESAQEHGIVTTDLERRVLTWNAGAEKIVGYSAEEMIGRPADIFFTKEDVACGRPAEEARQCLEKGSASDDRWHVRKDGSRFFANGVMMPLRSRPGGEILGFVKIMRDETEAHEDKVALERSRIKLVEALSETQNAREELEAASQAKDQFLAVLSHELRTPLTPVLMAARTLSRRKDLPEPVHEALDMIRRNVQIEARFIDDLLDITRITRGKMELALVPFDFHEVVQSAIDVCRPDVEARRQTLTLILNAGESRLEGDPGRLQQVVWNLLKNASKFAPEEGTIILRTFNEAGRLVLEVSDNGIGIEPEARARIFDAFAQANREITRQFGGLGLGLAISKAAVDAHGGELHVSSDGPGKGATFIASLPLKDPIRSKLKS